MGVAETVDEIAGDEVAHLRDHHRQERIGRDVEGNAQEHVGASLVQVTRQAAVHDVKLKQNVAGRKPHVREVPDIPGADDVTSGIGVVTNRIEHAANLIDLTPVGRSPRPPLGAIDRAEIPGLVGPLLPDLDAVF